MNVELAVTVDEYQGCFDELLVQFVGEVFFQGATVADELTGTFHHAHPDDGALTATNGLDGAFMVGRQVCLNLGFRNHDVTNGVGEFFGCGGSCSNVSCIGLKVFGYVIVTHWATCLIS